MCRKLHYCDGLGDCDSDDVFSGNIHDDDGDSDHDNEGETVVIYARTCEQTLHGQQTPQNNSPLHLTDPSSGKLIYEKHRTHTYTRIRRRRFTMSHTHEPRH